MVTGKSLDTAKNYAERVRAALKQGRYTVDGLRVMVKHPSLFVDDWTGLSEDQIKTESRKMYDSANKLLRQAEAALTHIERESKVVGKREPTSNMTNWGKSVCAWLVGIGHCARHAPNSKLDHYTDTLREKIETLVEETEVNNAFAALVESSIEL